MKKINWNWVAWIVGGAAFLTIINNLNGAVDRAAEEARLVRDSIRIVVVADSISRVQERERFEERLEMANESALEALRERSQAELEARTARNERDLLSRRINALPDSVTMVPRPVFDSVVVASVEIERALMAVNETLVADTVRLSDLLRDARMGWDGEIESHDLTRGLNDANRALAEAFERAANPGFFSKLWEGKEEFVIGIVVGAVAISVFGGS